MAISGVGTVFSKWVGSAYVAIAEVKSITGPGMSRETIDTTALGTTGGYRTFISSFRDPGTLSLNMGYTRDGYDAMHDDFENEELQTYQIALPDLEGTLFEFEGIVNELPLTIDEGQVTMDVTIQISGPVTVSSASSA